MDLQEYYEQMQRPAGFIGGSSNIYRDTEGVIRNLRDARGALVPSPNIPGEVEAAIGAEGAAPAPAATGPRGPALSPLAARYAQAQAGGPKLDDPFGIAAAAYRGEQNAAEMQAYKLADFYAQFLPPERILPEVERMTGIRLGAATTPNLLKRRETEASIRSTQAQTDEREEDAAKKAQERREAPVREYGALESTMNGLNRIEAVAAQLRDAPGLWRAAGPVASKAPTISGRTADIERKVENLKSNLALRTLAQIRDESKTGGALGNVSNYDVQLLENAIANVSLAQSPEAFRKAMDDVVAYSRNLREQAGRAYAGKHGAPPKVLPQAAMAQLEKAPPGEPVRFGNGQVWVVKNGVPVRVR